jgi:hypothetical protein
MTSLGELAPHRSSLFMNFMKVVKQTASLLARTFPQGRVPFNDQVQVVVSLRKPWILHPSRNDRMLRGGRLSRYIFATSAIKMNQLFPGAISQGFAPLKKKREEKRRNKKNEKQSMQALNPLPSS